MICNRWIRGVALGAFLSLASWGVPARSLLAGCASSFHRGDANGDSRLNLTDPIYSLGYLFLGTEAPGCLDAADADDNGRIDLADAVATVLFLFLGGDPIPPPGLLACGEDPTPDGLSCATFPFCGPPDPNRCTDNDCCDPGSYCEKTENDCDGVGFCSPRPDRCPDIVDPWCGCDGITYGNRCEAARAGVSVVHRGVCGQQGGCTSNDECDRESFCARPEGLCALPGECQLRPPGGCPENFDPVCGCDGVTYGNRCEAAQRGVSVAFPGECPGGGECKSNLECGPGQFCARNFEQCEEPGVCSPRPEVCPAVFDPVCGCDGLTYGNKCEAAAAGVSVRSVGECGGGPNCKSEDDCDAGAFCSRPEGFCDEPGFCKERPSTCEDEPEFLVCGCDDVTYRNFCTAALAGVTVAHVGACDGLPRCTDNENCADDAFCSIPEGACFGRGKCAPRPAECPADLFDPVCACNKRTYANECLAAQDGFSVAFRGSCEGNPVNCRTNQSCGADGYCEKAEGDCDGIGDCKLRPRDCPDVIDLVCGCDGITYQNDCFARVAGVNVARRGACEE